jgi:alkanesulfonate monooxygenase SsuD/methylene tetrahydromethanopterin reductase-like flavin-dependent oxidoreductase (luciferase family)
MRALLDGEGVEVGAARPARLPHHRPVPIWIAAGGPRTLRMAGGVADGIFIRVGTHAANIAVAVDAIRAGAAAAGRDPSRVRVAAVFHTVLVDEPGRALAMGKSMAAGYYEYSPTLFEPPGLAWRGPDLEASGRVVDFLPAAAADAFCLRGGPADIVAQLLDVIGTAPVAFDYVCLHPIPNPAVPDDPAHGYMARVAREVLPRVRAGLGSRRS